MALLGIFDSGIGGLSLVDACKRLMPGVAVHYVADVAHQPYGRKSAAQVREYCRSIAGFLQDRGADAVIAACSTASAVAVPELSQSCDIPVLGLLNQGWVGEALRATRNGRIGILATPLTVQNGAFADSLLRATGKDLRVFSAAAPLSIDAISEGSVQKNGINDLLARELQPLLDQGVDTLIIGCTHFNFVLERISEITGTGIAIVNPRDFAAQEAHALLRQAKPISRSSAPGQDAWFATGDVAQFQALARRLWKPDCVFQPLGLDIFHEAAT